MTENVFYRRAKKILAPLFRFFLRIKAVGVENVPTDGGLVLCSNHIAALDVISIGAVCPRQLTFVAKKELFSVPVLGWVMKKLGAIQVDRSANDISAIRTSVNAASNGGVLSIFPQGTRCPGVNPESTKIHSGAAMIAYRSGCDILPVSIKIKGAKYGFLKRIEVVFGEVIPLETLNIEEGTRTEYAEATERVFKEVCKLCDYGALPDYVPNRKKKRGRR